MCAVLRWRELASNPYHLESASDDAAEDVAIVQTSIRVGELHKLSQRVLLDQDAVCCVRQIDNDTAAFETHNNDRDRT